MPKIIEIKSDVISIGMEDGKITEVRREDVGFQPSVGDMVDFYQNDFKTIVSKKEASGNQNPLQNGGINVNVVAGNNANQQQPVYVSSNTKAVNKVVYCLLALFLGGIGIHKFYAGKIGTGIVYILFVWTTIPLIISFFEFIIALCKKADANGNILI